MANIKSITSDATGNKAVIELKNRELILIENALFKYYEDMPMNETGRELYNAITICRNIASYGCVDDFTISTLKRDETEHDPDDEDKQGEVDMRAWIENQYGEHLAELEVVDKDELLAEVDE